MIIQKNVTYGINLDRITQQWQRHNFDDHAGHGFPQFAKADLTIVTHGSYQIEMADSYITDMAYHEAMELNRQAANDPDVDWDDWNALCFAFPSTTNVYIYDQLNQPLNWDNNNLGHWFNRRLIIAELPGRHSSNTYRVIIEYIPTNWDLPNNFVNPFGFTQQGLDRIVGYGCRRYCKIGFRQAGCCSHVAALLIYLGVYSYDRNQFTSKHKIINLADPISSELPPGLSRQQHQS